jgi:hypothetical protein
MVKNYKMTTSYPNRVKSIFSVNFDIFLYISNLFKNMLKIGYKMSDGKYNKKSSL